MAQCSSCGRQLDGVSRFCTDCGAPVASLGQADESAASAPLIGESAQCAVCGAELLGDDLFCADCGARVGVASGPAARGGTAMGIQDGGFVAGGFAAPHDGRVPPMGVPTAPMTQAAGQASTAVPPTWRSAGGGSFGEYLSFRRTLTAANGVVVFWIAEGVNVLFWLLLFVNYRYNGASAFLWAVSGAVVLALVIWVAVATAVDVGRVSEELAEMRRAPRR